MRKLPAVLCVAAAAAWLVSGIAQALRKSETSAGAAPGEKSAAVPAHLTLNNQDGKAVARYVAQLPAGEPQPSVKTGGFLHPLYTPSGEQVTDLAPADHPHHRGVFLAWVQMVGRNKAADFWGWGARAPTDGRTIVTRQLRATGKVDGGDRVVATNEWLADNELFLREKTTVTTVRRGSANVIDLEFHLSSPEGDVKIEPSAFGGFCYRAKPRGTVEVTGPAGKVELANSAHDKPETDWPAATWYDMTYRSEGGKVNGVAVMNHPQNPPTRWHVHRGIHMLNPCIVADGPVTITQSKPLVLRYRLVAHDGPARADTLDGLHRPWAGLEVRDLKLDAAAG